MYDNCEIRTHASFETRMLPGIREDVGRFKAACHLESGALDRSAKLPDSESLVDSRVDQMWMPKYCAEEAQ